MARAPWSRRRSLLIVKKMVMKSFKKEGLMAVKKEMGEAKEDMKLLLVFLTA